MRFHAAYKSSVFLFKNLLCAPMLIFREMWAHCIPKRKQLTPKPRQGGFTRFGGISRERRQFDALMRGVKKIGFSIATDDSDFFPRAQFEKLIREISDSEYSIEKKNSLEADDEDDDED